MGIVAIGAIFVDLKGYPQGTFIPTDRNIGNVKQMYGGVTRNVVENIANLKLRPTYLSLVDDTDIGESVIRNLTECKVNTKYIQKSPSGMGTWMAIYDANGKIFASVSMRPDLTPIGIILDEYGDEIFSTCDSIVLEIDMDLSIVKRIFYYAKKYGKKIYALVSNMNIAVAKRELLQEINCLICSQSEAGILFAENFSNLNPEEMKTVLKSKISQAQIPSMVVTMGQYGSVYATMDGDSGSVSALKVPIADTSGCGDAFRAGVVAGLTYGKTLAQSCEIGSKLAASVIGTSDRICPKFMPGEFDLPISSD